jgi:long-chain acyl-CoA synthetase
MDWRDAEREYTDEVITDTTLGRMFDDAARRHENRPAQQYKGGIYDRSLSRAVLPEAPPGGYHAIAYDDMREIVANLATGFRELGVDRSDRIGMFSNTRMEWAQCDFALLSAGAVVTTVYPGSSDRQTRYLLGDAGATGVVVENQDLMERVLSVEDELDLSHVVVIDEFEGHEDRDDVRSLASVYEMGEEAFDADDYDAWLDGTSMDDLASLIYTSGTTGRPKGVELTHRNFRSNVSQCRRRFGPRPDKPDDLPVVSEESRSVSYLPLAHVFERLSGHFLMFASGATVSYGESPDTLREDFQLFSPTVVTSVPRVYEKIYGAIQDSAAGALGGYGSTVFEWATAVGREYDESDSPGVLLRWKHSLADRLIFSNVREALGDNVEFLISGGGSLSPDLARLYRAMDLPILEGYGLTETAPVLSVNPPEDVKVGTIGPPVIDVEIRLDTAVGDDLEPDAGGEVGELLVDGPNVFEGYWNRPDETEATFTPEGFFRTGDIVERRPDDYLTFRERAKELLVLSTGKNVTPGLIEDAFGANPLVEQAMVVGDSRKFVAALVVPNFAHLRNRADEQGIDLPDDPEAVCGDERVRERFQREIDAVNEQFEDHEMIKKFRLVPEEWTEGNDMLTPTMKKKRRNILERHRPAMNDMYSS